MSKAQLATYANPVNRAGFDSIKSWILHFVEKHKKPFTIRELAWEMQTTYKRIQPRISELISSGQLIEVGTKKEGNRTVSILRMGAQTDLFHNPKKTRQEIYREAVRRYVDPELLEIVEEEFKRLIKLNKK